jgi:signal peptide peptidase SppA
MQLIPIINMLTDRPGYFTGTSYRDIDAATRAAVGNPMVGIIGYEIHSPGGSVAGLKEVGATIAYASQRKPTVAFVSTLAASAAYHLASQTREIILSPSGEVGSVGVFSMHADFSRQLDQDGVTISFIHAAPFKIEANPYQPLGDEARVHIQSRVNEAYDEFVAAVARGRKRSEAFVKKNFGQGRTVTAELALASGMVNSIQSLDSAISRILNPPSKTRSLKSRLALAEAWDPEL